MRILFLTSRLPYPPDRGDRLRTFHFLRTLAADHAVTLVSFAAADKERAYARELTPFCEAVHLLQRDPRLAVGTAVGNAWRGQPLQSLYYRSNAMSHRVDQLIARGRYDVAYAHLFRMAPYLAQHTSLYRVIDFTDLISLEIAASLAYQPLFWRAVYRFELPRIRAYERAVAAWADEIWFINQRDRNLFARDPHHAGLQTVPNGLPLLRSPDQTGAAEIARGDVLFVGNLDVRHNIDAIQFLLQEIMPLVWEQAPQTTLLVVGAGDPRPIRGLSDDSRFQVAGYVSDLRSTLQASAVFVAPLRFAAGTQNKVLEAMAAATPVVATTAVLEGLDAGSYPVMRTANDAVGLATHIVALLHAPVTRTELGQAGQAFVRERFSWQAVAKQMEMIDKRLSRASGATVHRGETGHI